MIPQPKNTNQISFFSSLEGMINPKHPLYILANKIDWNMFEEAFSPLYSQNFGRPAKPIRLMVGLLIIKHLRNISDESVVDQWSENIYYQYLCGGTTFTPGPPCEASELVHFRKRIGESGIELILKESIRINGKDAEDDHVNIDTTVQEKNITYPTDSKLHAKIINRCKQITDKEQLPVRQTYTRVLKEQRLAQRFRNHPKNKAKAIKADRKIKTIAGRLVRELERNLTPESRYQSEIALFYRILSQTRTTKDKIYSIHEPEVCCISKGKEHKKYEFGNKASFVKTDTGVITGAMGFRNEYDGHTLMKVLEQVERLTGKLPKIAKTDRGYRGQKQIGETEILIPTTPRKSDSYYKRKQLSRAHRKRAGIEPVIGHIKADHRLNRNFYKGVVGDNMNIMLAAAAFNFKRMMNKWKSSFFTLLQSLLMTIMNHIQPERTKLIPHTHYKITSHQPDFVPMIG